MQIQVNVKRIGKRRNAIETRPYEIGEVHDVGGLVAAFITAEVARFNARAEVGGNGAPLSDERGDRGCSHGERPARPQPASRTSLPAVPRRGSQDSRDPIEDYPLCGGRENQGFVHLGADPTLRKH